MSYRIKLPMGPPEYGTFEKSDFGENECGCDGFMYVSILWPKDGGASFLLAGMDGRTQKPLSDAEMFKVWTMLASQLAVSAELGEGRKSMCATVIEHIRDVMKGLR